MDNLRKFLDSTSGKTSDDIINGLTITQLAVLMDLPDFESPEGLSEVVQNVKEALIAKGHAVTDESVVALFEKECLKWVRVGETFSVCQSLCGKVSKDAIVRRYVNLRHGGDGSAFFTEFMGENGAD